MLPKLMLDENLSPSLVGPLSDHGIDTVCARDRGLLGADDHIIWRAAHSESRTVVTINKVHFLRFARLEVVHPGVLVWRKPR